MGNDFPFGPPPFDVAHVDLASRASYGEASREQAQFREYMVRQRRTAWWARKRFGIEGGSPVWCFTRFGRSVTQLPFGALLYVGGEHEDWYDPDFCIYNDVVLEEADGTIRICGFGKDVFPPTDFHTATLAGCNVWLIGSLGYADARQEGLTQVMRLDPDTLSIEAIETGGENPGWINSHFAHHDAARNEIVVSGGKIWMTVGQAHQLELTLNIDTFALSLDTLVWRRLERR